MSKHREIFEKSKLNQKKEDDSFNKKIVESNFKNENLIVSLEMCFFCFEVLISHLDKREEPKPSFINDSHALFVTWTIGRDKKLRGCIGTFSALDLHYGLKEYAITSALKDTRFDPISKEELPNLHVSVSILTKFESGSNYLDWEIGKHGIQIELHSGRGHKHSATFLPEIAKEEGWDKLQTIDYLLRKGGYRGTINNHVRESIKLTRYQSEKIEASYHDYKEFLKVR